MATTIISGIIWIISVIAMIMSGGMALWFSHAGASKAEKITVGIIAPVAIVTVFVSGIIFVRSF